MDDMERTIVLVGAVRNEVLPILRSAIDLDQLGKNVRKAITEAEFKLLTQLVADHSDMIGAENDKRIRTFEKLRDGLAKKFGKAMKDDDAGEALAALYVREAQRALKEIDKGSPSDVQELIKDLWRSTAPKKDDRNPPPRGR